MVFAFLLGAGNAWPGETDAVAPLAASRAKPATNIANRPGVVLLPPYPTAHPFPVMDPWKVLNNRVLIETLRRGGLVLYMRHTETGNVTEQCVSSNLTARGEADAAYVGVAIRAFKFPIGEILSSDICRARDTAARLELGEMVPTGDLGNVPKRVGKDIHAARMKLLAVPPAAGTNNLLVGHMHQGRGEQGGFAGEGAIHLDFGEVVVFRPDGNGGSDAVARIRLEDWPILARLANITLRQDLR